MNPPDVPADAVPITDQPVSQTAGAVKPLSIRVIGLGGAGGNVLAQMAQTDLRELRLIALHTSARILEITSVPEKVLVGGELMQGLGVGGDLSLARAAAEHDLPQLKALCQGADLIFIVTGLGGGTGTGIAPVLARIGKACGALVLGVVTLPFDLEGSRRRRNAEQGLQELKAAADAVIALPNQKIFRIVDENTTVRDSFKITNDLLAQGIRGIWQMLAVPGLLHVDFADLCSLLRDRHCESSFATVQAQGEGRAREIVDQLLACPLLESGQVLADAEAVLVNLVGGPDLSMADVKRIMEEINRRTGNVHLVMGASISEHLHGQIGLTLVASHPATPQSESSIAGMRFSPSLVSPGHLGPTEIDFHVAQPPVPGTEGRFGQRTANGSDVMERSPSSWSSRPSARSDKSPFRLQQGSLPLEMVSKGRFEKTSPTIHGGENLDLPTYVRRGIPLN